MLCLVAQSCPTLCSPIDCSLEKCMATHSSILAWRIPWTEKPGRLHSIMGFIYSCINLFSFGCPGSSLLPGLFSQCGEWGLLSSCSAWTSRCGGFSCCRAWALGCSGFSSCDTGLCSCSSRALEHKLCSCGTWT